MATLGREQQQQAKESSNPPVSKLQKLKITHEKKDNNNDSEGSSKKNRPCVANYRVLRLGSKGVTVTIGSTKTPQPPVVPKSKSFYQKSRRVLHQDGRPGGDGEACEEGEESIDYCSIERLPGDGCFSESADDYELSNLSDGYDEEDFEEENDLESDINEETCGEELSQRSSSSDSEPSTANSSRASSAQISSHLHRDKQVKTLSAKRYASAGTNLSKFEPTKTSPTVSRKGCWTAGGTTDIRTALTASLFPNVASTIHFTVDGERVHSFPSKIKKLLKWKMSTITPNVIKLCIARSGFRPTKKNDWLGYWGKHMKSVAFKSIREFQKVNHFPGTFQIGRKDRLWKNLSKFQARHGKKEFGFIPQTFVLPHDFRNFKRVWEEGGNRQKWILKPPASARGIGIRVVHKWNQIPRKRPVVVQKYLSKPFLINGKKFDLRIYVFVSSFDPLRIYVFEEGLTRFATCKYSSSSKSLNNKFMHLTNYSINKKNEDAYIPNNDEDACQGHKWSLKALWGYLKRMGVNTTRIWENIKDIVAKTIISCESTVNLLIKQNLRNSYSCKELFGFDIMLDENLKPWLLEVNISPSLHSTSPLDLSIKGQMVRDLLNISGYRIPENVGGILAMTSFSNTPENGRASLSSDQKAKHGYYVNHHNDERMKATILDFLTPEDIRVLIETEDEYSRRGCFQRIFPSENSLKYLKFFETPRYRNILLDEWIKKHLREGRRTALGVALLCSYALKGIHLRPFSSDPNHQWVSPQPCIGNQIMTSSAVCRSLSAPAASRRSEEKIRCVHTSLKLTSRGERRVETELDKRHVKYIREKTFSDLKGLNGGNLRYDFAIIMPEKYLLIEYDGPHHFRPTRWYRKQTDDEMMGMFRLGQSYDHMKDRSPSQVSLPRIKRKSVVRYHHVPKQLASSSATLTLKTKLATKTYIKKT